MTIHRLRLYYSLTRLILSRDPVASLSEIRIVSSRFSVDLERDRELVDLVLRLAQGAGNGAAGARTGAGAAGALSALHARLTGENVSISVRAPQGDVNVGGLFFEVGAQGDVLAVQARGVCEAVLPGGFAFSTSVRTLGKVGRGLDWSDLTVRVLSFASSIFSTGRQTVQVVWRGSELIVSKIQDRSPIDLRVAADLGARRLTLDLRAQEFRPDRLFRLEGKYARLNPWLRAPLTASGSAVYGLADGSLAYEAELSALFDDQLPVREVRLASRLHGTARQVWFEPLQLDSPTGSLSFIGNLLFANLFPEGLLTLTDFDAWQGEKLNANVAIHRMSGRLEVKGTSASVGEIGFDRLEAAIEPGAEGVRVAVEASFEGVRDDGLSAAGLLAGGALSFTAALRGVPADRLYHLATGAVQLSGAQQDLKTFLGPLTLTADLSGATDLVTFSVSSPRLALSRAGDPDTALSAAVLFSSDRLAVTGIDGSWQGISLAGDLRGQRDAADRVRFASALRVQGTPYEVEGTWSAGEGLAARGSYGLSVAASRGRTGVLGVSARATELPLPIPGGPRAVSFDVQGSFPARGEWAVSAPAIQVFDLPFLESKTNRMEVSLRLTPRRLEVDRIRFADPFSTLDGSAAADISGLSGTLDAGLLDRMVVLASATLQGRGTAESYRLKGDLREGVLSAAVDFAGSPIARLAAAAVKGSLAGSATVSGPLSAPALALDASLKEGRLGTDPLAMSARIGLAGGVMSVRGLSVGYVSHKLVNGEGTLDLGKGTYDFSGVYTGEYFLDEVRLAAGLKGTFPAGRPAGVGMFNRDIRGTLDLGRITVNGTAMPGWDVSIRTEDGALRLDGGPGNSVHGTLWPDMSFRLATAAPLPLSAEASGRIAGDRISATVEVSTADLRVLNAMMKSPIISITSGAAFGRLQVEGPVNDPDFSGSLEVVGGGLLARTYCPDEIGPVSTRFVFDGKTFRGGPVTATAGPGGSGARPRSPWTTGCRWLSTFPSPPSRTRQCAWG